MAAVQVQVYQQMPAQRTSSFWGKMRRVVEGRGWHKYTFVMISPL